MIRTQFAIAVLMFSIIILAMAVYTISKAFGELTKRMDAIEKQEREEVRLPPEAHCAGGCGKQVPYIGPESHLICRECLDKSVDKILDHHSV